MKRNNWLISLGLSFLLLSLVTYYIHFLIFKDSVFIFRYFVAQLGFLPISTFLVTIVLNQLMGRREKNIRMQKLNMVIGAFFSDVGTDLLRFFTVFDPQANQYGQNLKMNSSWSKLDFDQAKNHCKEIKLEIKPDKNHLENLNSLLSDKRNNLLRLLENPNLLEHESFSQLLRAIFHLAEELDNRIDLGQLPASDYAHLRHDIERAYLSLIYQWLSYMEHLNHSYPYLFSLAMRTNPFDPGACVEITE